MANSFAEEIKESHEMDCEQADELLKTIVLANRKPNYAENGFFSKLGWDERQVNDQMRRMNSVLRLQAIAGREADRQAAMTEAETAAAIAEKELPKIDKKLADLQSQRDAIQRDARLSARRCEEQTQAVLQLRELTPQHIRDSVNQAVSAIANTLRRDVLDSEARIHELQCCTTPSKYQNQPLYLEALKRSFREAITDHVEGRSLTYRLSPQWPAIRGEIEVELFELKAQLPDMKAAHTTALEAAEAPLDYYSSNQPAS